MKVNFLIALICLAVIAFAILNTTEPMANLPPSQPLVPSDWFMANNPTGPQCCKDSIFSTQSGCMCVTDEQKQLLLTRGGNRTHAD